MFWMGLCVFVYFSVLFPLWMILYGSMFKLVCFHRKIFTQIMTCSIVSSKLPPLALLTALHTLSVYSILNTLVEVPS